jgi:hypothetical protein
MKNTLSQEFWLCELANPSPSSLWFVDLENSYHYYNLTHCQSLGLKRYHQFFSTHRCWNKCSLGAKPQQNLHKLCFGACLEAQWFPYALNLNFWVKFLMCMLPWEVRHMPDHSCFILVGMMPQTLRCLWFSVGTFGFSWSSENGCFSRVGSVIPF